MGPSPGGVGGSGYATEVGVLVFVGAGVSVELCVGEGTACKVSSNSGPMVGKGPWVYGMGVLA
jgi:hypothetical protein